MSSRERAGSDADDAFRGTLFRAAIGKLLGGHFAVIGHKPLETNDLGDFRHAGVRHSPVIGQPAILATDSANCPDSDPSDAFCRAVPQSPPIADAIGGRPIAEAIGGEPHVCPTCGGGYWWRSHRGDLFCVACRPPKRNSATFVKQRLVYNDELQALEDFDEALAIAGIGPSPGMSTPASTATQGPIRPQRPRGRGGAGAAEPGPPPGQTVDEWWESLIEPDVYFACVAEGERHCAAESRRERALVERQAALAKKSGRDRAVEKIVR